MWYAILDDGTYFDGWSSDMFMSDVNDEYRESVAEFGIINKQRDKIIRFTEDTLHLGNTEFGIEVDESTELIFEMKRHVRTQVGATVEDSGLQELPTIYYIGYKTWAVGFEEETHNISYRLG